MLMKRLVRDQKRLRQNKPTFIARVCIHVDSETTRTIEAFGTMRTSMSSPAVRLLVSSDRSEAIICAEVTM
jgi:hypothetical protein